MKALHNWSASILNSLKYKYKYTNAFTEGMNNNIKVLKRIAYGYRNFDNFRRRMLCIYSNGKAAEIPKNLCRRKQIKFIFRISLICYTPTFDIEHENNLQNNENYPKKGIKTASSYAQEGAFFSHFRSLYLDFVQDKYINDI